MKSFIQYNVKGQSLVEVIVACGILAVVMAAVMSIVIASRNLLYTSEDQTKATTLAQEGIEIARHQRDVGCGFDQVKGEISSGNTVFVILGDTNGTIDETLKPESDPSVGDPTNITHFGGFARFIHIQELSSNSLGMDTSGFDCSDPNQNHDCADKYYAIQIDIHKGGTGGPIISQVRTIISK